MSDLNKHNYILKAWGIKVKVLFSGGWVYV